jgi:outer membrane protein insertion porin family
VFWDEVWRNNLSYGFIQPNDSSDVPFNQLFLLGGPFNLRGFEQFTLGTKKFSTKACDAVGPTTGCVDENNQGSQPWNVNLPYGGRQQFFYNLEFEFPLIQEVGMKGVVFYDLGNAEDEIDLTSLRSDVGFGFRWFSPIGPLRFEWGFPIDRRVAEGEVGYQFYFTIGSPF